VHQQVKQILVVDANVRERQQRFHALHFVEFGTSISRTGATPALRKQSDTPSKKANFGLITTRAALLLSARSDQHPLLSQRE
jgi:hypothetical protein